MSGYGKNRPKDAIPKPKGNAPLCACGCGNRTSTVHSQFILGHRPTEPIADRLMRRVSRDAETGCWNWVGSRYSNGYGRFSRGRDGMALAHRAAYELLVGPIPEGLVIDHLCRNRACVNPEHLEPVTQAVNVARAAPADWTARRAEALSRPCPKGHERAEHSVVDARGNLRCVQCGREASLRHYHQKRGAS